MDASLELFSVFVVDQGKPNLADSSSRLPWLIRQMLLYALLLNFCKYNLSFTSSFVYSNIMDHQHF